MKDIGSLLVEQKAVTNDQLTQCQQEIAGTHQPIERCLLEKNMITPEQLAKAYAQVRGIAYIDTITEIMADPLLLAQVSLKFLRENVVMPVKIDGVKTILT